MFAKIKNLKSWLIVLTAFILLGMNLQANSSLKVLSDEPETEYKYEDEDLLNFVQANREISELRRDVNNDISEIVEEAGLTMERFNQIARASQIGALDSGSFDNEEIAAFNEVGPMVNELRQQMRSMSQAILAEKELSSELYQEILRDYRQDEELQQYVRHLLREKAREEAFQKRKRELMEEKGLT